MSYNTIHLKVYVNKMLPICAKIMSSLNHKKNLTSCFLFLSDGLSVFIIFTKATTQRSLRYGLDETTSQRVVKR